ncbi:MAG: bacterial Ig-like domain-containing protein, partial [Bacilli bacterium]|nr:bacterial Ig-like domain-containing protein [Bacilli bacterium]
ISQSPSKLEYLEGTDEIDLSDGKLLLTYFDNSTEEIPLNKAIVSKFNKNQVGEQTVTINYAGLTTNLTVSVISINIQDESISLSDNIIKINLNRSNKNTGIKCTELTDKITTSNNLVFYNESNEIITNDAIIKNGYILGINDNNNNEIIKIPIIIIGDINSDGIVNINDAKKLAENIITKIELDVDIKKYASDINNDNNVKINDITLLLKNINAN